MRRVGDDRQDLTGLLERRPHLDRRAVAARGHHVNQVDQYRALINLFDRGLLTAEEFDRQRARISGR